MKKMILLVSMLAGIMTFSGCVDDKESPSVTAVRQAKAAQLNAIAAHQNALAAYQQMLTEKDAAIKEAEAAIKAAQAEAEKAATEQAKAEAQVKIAEAQARLAELANAIEIANLKAQQDLLTAQAAYDQAVADADSTKRAMLSVLYGAYTTAVDNLFGAQQNLINAKINLARYQAGLDNEDASQQIALTQLNNQIAEAEEQIAEKEAMIEIYEAQKAPDEVKAELAAAKATQVTLRQARQKAIEAVTAANTTLTNANATLNSQKYVKTVKGIIYGGLQYNGNNISNNTNWEWLRLGDENGVEGADGKPIPATVNSWYLAAFDEKEQEWNYTKVLSAETGEKIEKTVTVAPGIEKTKPYTNIETYYELDPEGVKAYIDTMAANIEAVLYGDVDPKTLAGWKDAVAKTQKDLADAEKASPKDQATIDALKNQLAEETKQLNKAQIANEEEEAWLAAIQEAFDSMVPEEKNVQAAVEAVNTAAEAVCDAQLAKDQADYNLDMQDAKVIALQNVVNGSVQIDEYGSTQTIADAINSLQTDIQNLNSNIANYKRQIAQIEEGQTNSEYWIEYYQKQIAHYEAQVEVYEKEVADAKATLDAATAAQGE